MDVSLCKNEECMHKNSCVRYTTKSVSKWQSYLLIVGNGSECDMYWPLKKKKKLGVK